MTPLHGGRISSILGGRQQTEPHDQEKIPQARFSALFQQAPVDPHYDREAARYGNPIASREVILDILGQTAQPLDHAALCQHLHIKDGGQTEALRKRLRAMERDGQLMVNRRGAYGLVDKLDLVRGRIQGHRDGFGFVIPNDGSGDLYLNARQMALVFDGDEVLACVSGTDHRGRKEGKVVEVLQRATMEIVGRYYEESGIGSVVPDNARIRHDVLIPQEGRNGAQHGQIVVAALTDFPTRRLGARGRIKEVLGEHLDPGLEIEMAIRSHNIPYQWPEDVPSEAAALGDEPDEADKEHRLDLRDLPFVTIDGEDAKDFDDAVHCEQTPDGSWRLRVAIADVSHYVRPGSALDREASHRGNSVYFPERVVPMLPEALSNGLCSLRPGVDRLAMICEMDISGAGELDSYQFGEGVIRSRARLTYTQVGKVLDGGQGEMDEKLIPHLLNLQGLYRVLRKAREKRGAIDFETVETRIIFDRQRKIDAIVPVERNDAHKLIEECMLCANVATARFLQGIKLPALYRVHDGPTAEKLENLRSYLAELGLNLAGGEKPTPAHYQALLTQVGGRPDAHVIQTMMLRSLSQAVYRPQSNDHFGGHFGLNYPAYAHFTSPIRRYPDLLVHRGIRRVLRSDMGCDHVLRTGGKPIPAERIFPYDTAAMAALGEHCSVTERRADDATREVEAWLKCEYLRDHVGEEFDGVVAAVTGFGMFVELNGIYIDGLVHVSALPMDYYHYDRGKQRLTGERGGRSFNLGDAVRVQVARVDLEEKKIDLELVGEQRSRRKGQSDGKKSGKKGAGDKKSQDRKSQGKKSAKKSGGGKSGGGKPGGGKPGGGKPGGGKPGGGKPGGGKPGGGKPGGGKPGGNKSGGKKPRGNRPRRGGRG